MSTRHCRMRRETTAEQTETTTHRSRRRKEEMTSALVMIMRSFEKTQSRALKAYFAFFAHACDRTISPQKITIPYAAQHNVGSWSVRLCVRMRKIAILTSLPCSTSGQIDLAPEYHFLCTISQSNESMGQCTHQHLYNNFPMSISQL